MGKVECSDTTKDATAVIADMRRLPISLLADAFSVKYVKFACHEPEQVIANEAPPASAFDVLMKARTQRCLPEKR